MVNEISNLEGEFFCTKKFRNGEMNAYLRIARWTFLEDILLLIAGVKRRDNKEIQEHHKESVVLTRFAELEVTLYERGERECKDRISMVNEFNSVKELANHHVGEGTYNGPKILPRDPVRLIKYAKKHALSGEMIAEYHSGP